MNKEQLEKLKIVLFDGVCNLCAGSVRFIAKRDKRAIYKFVWAQSETGKELLEWCGLPADFLDTVIYIENGVPYYKSSAALKIATGLSVPWPILAAIGLRMPKSIRDWVYDRIAENRYRWFGRTDVCLVPDKNLTSRFL
jgi:predicted DCC family thiol-disulfide oxidoreductase YuxK